MARVNFPTHGNLEIPAELTFINPLEAKENWTSTGPGFTLGDKITTVEGPAIFGVVHGFVTQRDSSPLVLMWFNETDKYVQLRPDQIQLHNTAPSPAKSSKPPQGHQNTGQTCLSGCTLLANSSGGIQMREVRPGTFLLNAKGKKVRVTNVYFSRESTVMVQISALCHATITHPMIDTKEVDIATAILSCWGRTRHLLDPRPDLTEFQEQTEAIHTFLSSPEAVKRLENRHLMIPPDALSPRDKHPIEFTNGHIQLEWARGRWSVQKWKDMETSQPLWIQPEENFLSALIRPPSRPEPIAPEYIPAANLDRSTRNSSRPPDRPPQDNHLQEQALARQEWPHPNTTTMVLYMQK